jgi:hypothetical protein
MFIDFLHRTDSIVFLFHWRETGKPVVKNQLARLQPDLVVLAFGKDKIVQELLVWK